MRKSRLAACITNDLFILYKILLYFLPEGGEEYLILFVGCGNLVILTMKGRVRGNDMIPPSPFGRPPKRY